MPNYAMYGRRSQERDEKQVQSLDDQYTANVKLKADLGLNVVVELSESGSAKEPFKRPVFAQLIKLIEQGKVDGIVAWHPDRLARNEIDAAQITYFLRKGKLVDLKFVSYTFVNSPEGIMMLQLALSQSQYAVSKLVYDVKRGLHSKLEQGWRPRPALQGYANVVEMQGYSPVKKNRTRS